MFYEDNSMKISEKLYQNPLKTKDAWYKHPLKKKKKRENITEFVRLEEPVRALVQPLAQSNDHI